MITRRQTTFWTLDLGPRQGATTIHFRGKREFHHESDSFASIELSESHPLLADYVQPKVSITFKGRPNSAEALAADLDHMIRHHSSGWRTLEDYRNPLLPFCELLDSGSGEMLHVPRSAVDALRARITSEGISVQVHEGPHPSAPFPRALILGRSFVIADDFLLEPPLGTGAV